MALTLYLSAGYLSHLEDAQICAKSNTIGALTQKQYEIPDQTSEIS